MISSQVKRFILPFSPPKVREQFSFEVELASVYALAEFEKAKGGGLVVKLTEEKLVFVSQIGYPLWIFPCAEAACIFDGLNHTRIKMTIEKLPTAKAFMESLKRNAQTREDYMAFLSNNINYFEQPNSEIEISFEGLIVDLDFKKDFILYRREATEGSQLGNLAPLAPTLEEKTIEPMIAEIELLQSSLKEDTQMLPECIQLIKKITGQFITELDYAAQAIQDEANAKIKAQEELINPKIANLNREYKNQIARLTKSFDEELEILQKQRSKAEKTIQKSEEKIKTYQKEAKKQSQKNQLIYEKRSKEKSKKAKKELDGLKKELKRIEKNIKDLIKRKNVDTSKLKFGLEAEIKVARQPLRDLEASRDAKMIVFKMETEKLLKQEKPIIDELNGAVKLKESAGAKFEVLGIRDLQLKSPELYYVPFYVACYQVDSVWRYVMFPPSSASAFGFSTKLKGAFGLSKVKELLTSRFKSITALIDKCQALAKQNTDLDNQIRELGEKNNLLRSDLSRENIAKGLVYLNHEGWLSEKEYQALNNSLAHA